MNTFEDILIELPVCMCSRPQPRQSRFSFCTVFLIVVVGVVIYSSFVSCFNSLFEQARIEDNCFMEDCEPDRFVNLNDLVEDIVDKKIQEYLKKECLKKEYLKKEDLKSEDLKSEDSTKKD